MDHDNQKDSTPSSCSIPSNYTEAPRRPTESEVIDDLFDYHGANREQVMRMQNVREAAKYFAKVLLQNVPVCCDRGSAIEGLRLAVMMSNCAIVRDGRPIIK